MTTDAADFNHDRRRFITGAAAATVAVAAGGIGIARLGGGEPADSIRSLTSGDLDYGLLGPIAGERLRVGSAGAGLFATVASVSAPMTYRTDDGVSGATFSVILEATERLEQGIHEFSHTRLGSFPLFVVPVDLPSGTSFLHEAVFNRLD